MAIIPLQIKMVYGIGKTHGYELDQGHIRELLATLGVGLTSQYLEQTGRKAASCSAACSARLREESPSSSARRQPVSRFHSPPPMRSAKWRSAIALVAGK